MNHAEKTKLLWEFARGVENHDWEALEKTLKRFEIMREVSIAREMQREFYYRMLNSDDDKEKADCRQVNQNLEVIKKKSMGRYGGQHAPILSKKSGVKKGKSDVR